MERLETTYLVPGVSPATCFEYLGDAANGTEWNSFAKRVIAHGDPGVGRVIETRVGFLGITFGLNATVTEWEQNALYAVTSKVPFHAILRARFTSEVGGTRVKSEFEIEPGRFFPVPRIVLRKALKIQFDKDAAQLQRCLAALA